MKTESIESSQTHGGFYRIRVRFDPSDLQVQHTPYGVVLSLPDCGASGEPGAPALPRASIQIAVPEDTWPASLEVHASGPVDVTRESVLVAPIQPRRPGGRNRPPDAHDEQPRPADRAPSHCAPDRAEPPDDGDDFVVQPYPAPPVVPPNPRLYEQASQDRALHKLSAIQYVGLTPVLRVELRPVQLTERGTLQLLADFDIRVGYGPRPKPECRERLQSLLEQHGVRDPDVGRLMPLPEPTIVSRAQAKRMGELARAIVVNPEHVVSRWERFAELSLPADYLIITDNHSWNAETRRVSGDLAGDLIGEFERLAAWKRSRGVSAKVVTVSEIVSGRYGNFRRGSRDLQEIIRRFLKWAHTAWGVAWVLIGGDVTVVPARLAAGAVEGDVELTADDPPGNRKSHWTGSFLKMHVENAGTWWPGDWDPILVNADTGQLIPFDATGASDAGGLGWYYTTSDSYATRAAGRMNFVRVNGTAAVVNAKLQWLYQWNRIPTDFYYASLTSWVLAYFEIGFWFTTLRIPYVYVPVHDWDGLDNGLYGQFARGQDVGGIVWQTEVSVGRAPVQSAAEAATFVDKVIAYERFVTPDGTWLSGDWPEKLLIAASNWDDPVGITPTASPTPEDNRFHAGPSVTVCKLTDIPGFNRQLIADISDSDRRELAFNINGGSAPGWHFARSAVDHSPSRIDIPLPWGIVSFPIPSPWLVVHGSAAERNPRSFVLDDPAQDGSMRDQEQLREQLETDLPGWSQVSRLYKDETDLTPVQAAAGPFRHLTSNRVADALNDGPHIVSLSGHGSGDGCCGAARWTARGLRNGWHSFIAYADSCLTNQFDAEDAFSEDLLTNSRGGAVAYVGNSRFSWIGLGDDHQRAFFRRLAWIRHLGLANDIRCNAVDLAAEGAYGRWTILSLNLMGDPEMKVWPARRRRIQVETRWHGDLREPLHIDVWPHKPVPPGPPEPPEWLKDVVIHLAQPGFERTARPDDEGRASFDLQDAQPGLLTLTVSHPDLVPAVQRLDARGPVWLSGTVGCVTQPRGLGDGSGTGIRFLTQAGERDLLVRDGSRGCEAIVEAATGACAATLPISFLVEHGGNGAAVIGFRLCNGSASTSRTDAT